MHLRISAGHQTPDENFVMLNLLHEKIVNIHSVPLQKVLRVTEEHDRQPNEQPTLFHVLRLQKRRSAQVIRHIQDKGGQTQPTTGHHARIYDTLPEEVRYYRGGRRFHQHYDEDDPTTP